MGDHQGNAVAGSWLFKHQDLLMGPVPGDVIIDKLYSGEISPKTPVADESDDENWRTLDEVAAFSVHVAKAQARHRVLAEKKAHEKQVRRKTASRLATLTTIGIVLAVAVFAVVVWLVTTQPWLEEDEALADLQITVNPPVIALASAEDLTRGQELFLDVDVESPSEPASTGGRTPRPRRPRPAAGGTKAAAPAESGQATPAAAVTQRDSDGLGTTRSYDMDHIRTVLNRESRSLFPCIREEVRTSGFSGTIPFAFVINNDGRVGRLWIDERRLRGGEMQQCFERTMAGWRFNSFQGERPTVNHSFTIGGG